jgi:hypothetical protein
VLVLRFVSLGPESAVKPLIEARRGEKEKRDQELDSNCNVHGSSSGNRNGNDISIGMGKVADISRGDGTGSPIDANSVQDPSSISSCNIIGTNRGSSISISGSSTRVARIISVEQKMQRTATQKLQAERLVLAHGLFDMGTSLPAVKEKEKIKEEEDALGTKKSSDTSAIEDLFNENENGIHDASPRSDLPPCPEGTSEGHSSTFVYSPGDLMDEESTSKWFTVVCDRGAETGTGRDSSSSSPLHLLKPLIPTSIGAVSSSSSVSSDCTSASYSTSRNPPVSYPILSGVFESSLMALYSTPREIVDWSEWLRTLSVGESDRDDIDACVKNMLCSVDGSKGSGVIYGSSTRSSSSKSGSGSSSRSSSSSMSGRRRNTGLLSEDALWKQVQHSTVFHP